MDQDILQVHLNGAGGGGAADSDFFVSETLGYVLQDFDLAGGQRYLREVLAQTLGDFGRHQAFAGLYDANGAHGFLSSFIVLLDWNRSKPRAKGLIRTCTKRLVMSQANLAKGRSSVRPGEDIV